MGDFFISIEELKNRIGTAKCPPVFDMRRRAAFDEDVQVLPTARWRDHCATDIWAARYDRDQEIIVYCVHGHNVSQGAAAAMRFAGLDARVLAGGIEGWKAAGGVVMTRNALPHRDEDLASQWVTGRQPTAARIVCAWLVRRFIDRDARFLFTEPEQAHAVADEIGGVAFDAPEAVFAGDAQHSLFDVLRAHFGLDGAELAALASVLRGATEPRDDRAAERDGFTAVMRGVSILGEGDPHAALAAGFPIFDALYAWQKHRTDHARFPSGDVA